MPEILITVRNKLPMLAGSVAGIVANNSDYTVRFDFDEQWESGEKTVYFVRSGGFVYPPETTENDTVKVPVQRDVKLMTKLLIGVQQGDIKTSLACAVPVYASITDAIDDEALPPEPGLWDMVLKRLEEVEDSVIAVSSVNGQTGDVLLNAESVGARPDTWTPTAEEVGALPAGTAIPEKVSDLQNDAGFVTIAVSKLINYYLKTEVYNKNEAYSRTEVDNVISGIDRRLNAIADSSDIDLDQLSEIVAYIKSNRDLIGAITTLKVSISDIIDNLTTGDSKKPLSAAQGKKLAEMYNALPAWAKADEKPTYTKSEIGLGNVDNVKQYSEQNPPPYPVTSVNGQVGEVRITASGIGAAESAELVGLSATVEGHTSRLDSAEERITALEERTVTAPYYVDDSAACSKDVPKNALPFAEVNKIGGMTYKVNVGTEEAPVYELRSAPVTEVESAGVNLYSFGDKAIDGFQRFYFEKALPAGTYTVSALVSSTDTDDTRTALVFMNENEALAYAHMKRDVYNSVTITTKREVTSIRLLSSTSVAKSEGDSSTWQNVMIYKGSEPFPYTPYRSDTLAIPAAVQALDGYGWGIDADLYNYIDWDKKQFVQRVNRVDMGTLGWRINSSSNPSVYYVMIPDIKPAENDKETRKGLLCAKYKISETTTVATIQDKSIYRNRITSSAPYAVLLKDSDFDNNSSLLIESLQGEMLYYELAEPVITDISDLLTEDGYIPVEPGGTVMMKNEHGYDVPSEITFARLTWQ